MIAALAVLLLWGFLIALVFGVGRACGRADEILRDQGGPRRTPGGWRS